MWRVVVRVWLLRWCFGIVMGSGCVGMRGVVCDDGIMW